LFAAAREAAGTSSAEFDAASLADVLGQARERFGSDFAAVLAASRVWLNGTEPEAAATGGLHDGDEVAVLPPVSGG
jgi:molybdopterin synthase sulfur carrier subunit